MCVVSLVLCQNKHDATLTFWYDGFSLSDGTRRNAELHKYNKSSLFKDHSYKYKVHTKILVVDSLEGNLIVSIHMFMCKMNTL